MVRKIQTNKQIDIMANFNKAMLIGNIGRIDVKTFTDGKKIVNATLAVSEKYTDKFGNLTTSTEWFNLVIGGKIGDFAEKYIRQGDCCFAEGWLRSRTYTGKDNVERTVWEVVVHTLEKLSSPAGKTEQQAAPAPRKTAGDLVDESGGDENGDLPF